MSSAGLNLLRLTVGYGSRVVLADVSATVGSGTRLAVVGPNGVGKSTLLRVVAGEVAPESGSVVLSPPSATVGYLPQERDRRDGESLEQYLARRTGVAAADADLQRAAAALAREAPGSDDAYSGALERYLALGGADLDVRAPAVLADLGLDAGQLGQATTALSGGELARASLAAILLSQVDVLLLDEPTNDLDAAGLAQLEGFLLRRDGTLLVVSHDRVFLERVTDRVLELDEFTHRAAVFGGGFAAYVVERERARAAAQAAYDDHERTRTSLVDRARREKEWARAGAGRATSARTRREEPDTFIRAAAVASAQARGAAAARTLRSLDRLGAVEDPREPWDLRMTLATSARSGEDVAGLAGAVVERAGGDGGPAFRLGPVGLHVARGDRVAVTGRNGSGKTTLLAALLGRLPLTAGRQWLGASVVLGEIDQVRRTFGADEPLIDAFRARAGAGAAPDVAETRSLLAKFGLGAEDVLRPVASLSPGERTRADLALLVATEANLLVLDEPTNHLDLPAIEALETALATFDGTLLLVSHDRRLLERVDTDRHLVVEGGRVSEA